MSTRFAEACHRPFSNGTEEHEWVSTWCDYCVHDHAMHSDNPSGGCALMLNYMVSDDNWAGEAWLPEPDDGNFSLPSRLVCLHFKACHKDACNGDPGATERAERVAEVTAYWKENR